MKFTYQELVKNQLEILKVINKKIKLSIGDIKYWKEVEKHCYETFPKELDLCLKMSK